MRILVLGGNGFIGRHFVGRLVSSSDEVRVLGRTRRNDLESAANVSQVTGDFLDADTLDTALEGIDAVVHLISTTVPKTAEQDFAHDIETNLLGTVRLLDAMCARGIRKIVFVSSGGTVYGVPEKSPVSEQHKLAPINAYGITKVTIEHALELYRRNGKLDPVVLRVANPYGEGPIKQGLQGVIGNFLYALKENKPLTVFGDGSVVRDYVYVGDVAEALLKALHSVPCTYNIGSGVGRSVLEVILSLEKVTGRHPVVEHLVSNPYDVPALVLDTTLARERLQWSPAVDFEQGITRTWEWLHSN